MRKAGLNKLSIQNFKAFGTQVDVPIRPITLIFGENSSGKSSILHSLLFLNQMAYQPQDKLADITYTKAGGNSVDLGGLSQLKYGHSNSNNISFRIEKSVSKNVLPRLFRNVEDKSNFYFFANQYSFDHLNCIYKLEYFINDICIGSIDIPYETSNESPKIRIFLQNLLSYSEFNDLFESNRLIYKKYQDIDNSKGMKSHELLNILAKDNFSSSVIEYTLKKMTRFLLEQIFAIRTFKREDKIISISDRYIGHVYRNLEINFFTLQRIDNSFHTIPGKIFIDNDKFKGFKNVKDPIPFDTILAVFLEIILYRSGEIVNTVHELKYLGPVRTIPTRNFDTPDSISQDPSTGSTAWDLLATNQTAREHVNRWLDTFGTRKEIRTEQLIDTATMRQMFSRVLSTKQAEDELHALLEAELHAQPAQHILRFYDPTKNIYLSHRDMGVGISQVLPVIVNCVANTNTTILIEQPELHLHPRLQGDLADLFIETALTGEQKNTYLLETHSEALILRLLRRVREGVIKPDDIAILYVSPGEHGSTVKHIQVDEDGDFLDRWPNGFFEETYRDRMGL